MAGDSAMFNRQTCLLSGSLVALAIPRSGHRQCQFDHQSCNAGKRLDRRSRDVLASSCKDHKKEDDLIASIWSRPERSLSTQRQYTPDVVASHTALFRTSNSHLPHIVGASVRLRNCPQHQHGSQETSARDGSGRCVLLALQF